MNEAPFPSANIVLPLGEELVKRCTVTSPTKCEPCDENYYNDAYTYSRCKPCTDCNTDRGLQEIRPCQRTSNAVCTCLPGHAPKENQLEEKRCKPCPRGYFSKGGNMKCRPWTNCTASGSQTLRPGKQDEDAICDTPSSKIPTQGTIPQPTPFPKTPVLTMELDSSPTVVPTNPGFVWILITLVLLLAVAGALVLLFSYRRTKKKKLDILRNEIYAIPCKEENDFRMPIQEQEVGDKSEFVQG
ncbi:tumor necrosis factor receptor superfamily member 4 [Pseudonaja textilis]|uniref:tumor necrosis factor receptor superfamily member 4 n=1 Tax=Pseudonaja textilis TaxID=8673 RepID=UPI000EAA88FB|nr:tumor necrosis factor receptor superfamily member 4 [Pseudonaja textilis]